MTDEKKRELFQQLLKKLLTNRVIQTVRPLLVPFQRKISSIENELTSIKEVKSIPGPIGPRGFAGPKGDDGKDGSPDTPDEIKNKLESLKGEDRLDAKAIKNLPKVESRVMRALGGSGVNLAKNGATLSNQRSRINFIEGPNVTINAVDNPDQERFDVTISSSGGGVSPEWGNITGTLSDQIDLQAALDAKEDEITAGTTAQYFRGDKTFQTLDTSVVPDTSNKRYVTDAQLTVLGNTSGTNTGDETTPTIKTKLGAADSTHDGYLTSTDWNTFNGKGSGDASTNTSTSVDGEIALFSGTGGKTLKRATSTGILKATSGVIGTATSGTDYAPATSGTSILKGNGSGGFSNAASGTDYAPATSGTSILKGSGSGGFSNASAGTDYEVPLTFSTGLTRSTNTVTINTSQNIATLSNLTTNGYVKTSGGTGALSVQTVGIPATDGGTGLTTYSQGDIIYSSASNTLAKLAKDTNSTRYLSNTGTSNNPAWAQVDLTNGVTGALPAANMNNVVKVEGLARQGFINGGCQVQQRVAAKSISTSYQYASVDRFAVKATGTAVSAGTITSGVPGGSALAGSTGHCLVASGVTLTGSGIIYARYRVEAKDAVSAYSGQTVSFSVSVWHDVGSSVNFTIFINKVNSGTPDDWSSSTAVSNSGSVSVATSTKTTIKYENVSMGTVDNGFEVEIQAAVGAVTTKAVEWGDFQMNIGSVALPFHAKQFSDELRACQRYFSKSFPYATAPAQNTGSFNGSLSVQVISASTNTYYTYPWPVRMRTTPTVTTYNPSAANANWRDQNASADRAAATSQVSDIVALFIVNVTGITVGNICSIHWSADCEL